MATYTGRLGQLIKGSSTGGEDAVLTGVSRVTGLPANLPAMLHRPLIGVESQGVSGSVVIQVVGNIGGCTAVFAEGTVSADGGTVLGLTNPYPAGSIDVQSIPRPSLIGFSTTTASSGFTSTVFIAGEY